MNGYQPENRYDNDWMDYAFVITSISSPFTKHFKNSAMKIGRVSVAGKIRYKGKPDFT